MKRALHKEDIKAALRKRYGSLVEFERQHLLPEGSVRDVLRGKSVSRTATAMATALGVPFAAISPQQKRFRSSHSKSTKADLHSLNEGAK